MAVRLFSGRRAANDLAAGRITAADQSLYLAASFLIWIVPAYLFVFPTPRTSEAEFFWAIWLAELALVVLFCVTGIGYCLRKCRVDAARNFLVDFSCLNAPISLTTLAVVWGAYYVVEGILALTGVTSTRAYDVARLIASTSAVLVVFLRIGRHMERLSSLRESG